MMEALSERKKRLLSAIVQEHVSQADAVGSAALVDKYGLNVSSATIRNEMAELESGGYIAQPHTSAGRIPTEKGWRFYLEHFVKERPAGPKARQALERAYRAVGATPEARVKALAKALADLSREAVFVGFAAEDVFYTGLSNLFREPEFRQVDLIRDISEVIDHLDEVMRELFPKVTNDVRIILGKDNPFGQECGTVLVRYRGPQVGEGMFGILGPMRMPYDNHLGLIRLSKQLLEQS